MTHKPLLTIKKKCSGRDSQGHISVRHQGGQHKRFLRQIEWIAIDLILKPKSFLLNTIPTALPTLLFGLRKRRQVLHFINY